MRPLLPAASASLNSSRPTLETGRYRQKKAYYDERGDAMRSTTVTGKRFEYTGTLATGITVYFESGNKKSISVGTIRVIRNEIAKRSPVLMGANRQPLVTNSVGETLAVEHNESPQVMSYVLPLLIEEGFCTVSSRKPYTIRLK